MDLQDIVWCQPISFVVYVDEVCEHAHCRYESEQLACSEEAEEYPGDHLVGIDGRKVRLPR